MLQLALWGEPTPVAELGPVGSPTPPDKPSPPAAIAGQMDLFSPAGDPPTSGPAAALAA